MSYDSCPRHLDTSHVATFCTRERHQHHVTITGLPGRGVGSVTGKASGVERPSTYGTTTLSRPHLPISQLSLTLHLCPPSAMLTLTPAHVAIDPHLTHPHLSRQLYDQLIQTAHDDNDLDIPPLSATESGHVAICYELLNQPEDNGLWEVSEEPRGTGAGMAAGRSLGRREVVHAQVDLVSLALRILPAPSRSTCTLASGNIYQEPFLTTCI